MMAIFIISTVAQSANTLCSLKHNRIEEWHFQNFLLFLSILESESKSISRVIKPEMCLDGGMCQHLKFR